MNIYSFTSCFLFSVETQHTIGYGSRHTTEYCPEAIIIMCVQSITGVMIQVGCHASGAGHVTETRVGVCVYA